MTDELGDWRGEMLPRVRELALEAAPDVVEEIKWKKPSSPLGVPVWSRNGILFTGGDGIDGGLQGPRPLCR